MSLGTNHVVTRRGRAALMVGGVVATFGASAAHAGYYVSTVANTGHGYNRGCQAAYNAPGTTGATFVNNAGGGAPCDPAAFLAEQGTVVTVSGSTDTTGTLTASHDESSDVGPPNIAYATAAADLKTAKVHLSASASGFASANSLARLDDTLHFTVAGATATTVTYIPVSFAFDGTMPGTSDPATAYAELNYGFYFGNASAYEFGDYQAGYYGVYGTYPTFAYATQTPRVSGWQSYSFSSYTPLDTKFTGIYAIVGATADIPVDFALALNATNVALDYTNTGSISIGHVAGVSFTSDSGVFLTGAGAVPEPASWALLVVGFGVVGLASRRRRVPIVTA
jgi:hypothetical protein